MTRFSSKFKSAKPPMMGGMARADDKLTPALILVALVTIAGTIGFVQIEGWSLWRAFYFTIVTITTVGYGDEGMSDLGKKFTTILLIGGVTSASYTFAMIIQTSVASQFAWQKRMSKSINKLKDHTIVCGFGRLGSSVCEKLARRNSPFVVIERDPERFALAVDQGYLAIEGIASENGTLTAASLDKAKYVVAAVDSYAENLVIAMEAQELSSKVQVIARAERAENVIKLERAGVSRVLCPFESGGRETADFITNPGVANFLAQTAMGNGGIALAEVHIEKGSTLVGRTLAAFGKTEGDHISFVALGRDGDPPMIPPRGKTVITPGDRVIVAGDPGQIELMTNLARGRASAA
ncbi:MAG: voltage-gated potassium channel [Planctomycetota bacterium]|jgi:voltage-gated potassium channel